MTIRNIKHKYENTSYGDYDIIKYVGNRKYLGKCRKCGFEKLYDTSSIQRFSGQCRCSISGISIGDKFGKLTVLKRDLDNFFNDNRIYWVCQCDCGNIITVSSSALKSKNTQSCGCSRADAKIIDITNQRFGKLIAIEKVGKKNNSNAMFWKCQCDCGNTTIVESNKLRSGHTTSCGCQKSNGEYKIGQLLINNNIQFQKEYTIKILTNNKEHYYRFDFAILNNNNISYLIEYDGIQHYKDISFFNTSSLEETQERDKIKNNYCLNHNIPLIRIPYTHLNDICLKDLLPETSQFLIKESK